MRKSDHQQQQREHRHDVGIDVGFVGETLLMLVMTIMVAISALGLLPPTDSPQI